MTILAQAVCTTSAASSGFLASLEGNVAGGLGFSDDFSDDFADSINEGDLALIEATITDVERPSLRPRFIGPGCRPAGLRRRRADRRPHPRWVGLRPDDGELGTDGGLHARAARRSDRPRIRDERRSCRRPEANRRQAGVPRRRWCATFEVPIFTNGRVDDTPHRRQDPHGHDHRSRIALRIPLGFEALPGWQQHGTRARNPAPGRGRWRDGLQPASLRRQTAEASGPRRGGLARCSPGPG